MLDRIAAIKPEFARFIPLTPYKLSMIAGVCCFLITLPFDFVFVPGSLSFELNATVTFTQWFTSTSEFSHTFLGVLLTFIEYAIRDLLVLVVEITLNIISILLLKSHFNKKKRLVDPNGFVTGQLRNPSTATGIKTRIHVDYNLSGVSLSYRISKADERATVTFYL
jgi:hypothetical protein